MTVRKSALFLACLSLALAGCAKTDVKSTTTEATSTEPEVSSTNIDTSEPDLPLPNLSTVQVAEFESPVGMGAAPTGSDLYVIEQVGRVQLIRDGQPAGEILDISDRVIFEGEMGLLGIAISPDYKYMYLHYSGLDNGSGLDDGTTYIDEYAFSAPGTIDPSSRREVFVQAQPYSNHNGGKITFGPDGYLYIALGDGGSADDPHGYGQDLSIMLGKLLRIDPRPNSEGDAYTIPSDNPFVDTPNARPEIYAYGLRNPWQFSFDRATGDVWIADVGQDQWEEINHVTAEELRGANFGWNAREGSHEFSGPRPDGAIDPVAEYEHTGDVCSVTGGFIYRGTQIPALYGVYLFADYCIDELWGLTSRSDGIYTFSPEAPYVGAFGEDQQGELYMMSGSGGVLKIVE